MKKLKRYFYLIERAVLDDEPTSAVLDMLRYDGATIESNPPRGYYLLAATSPPTLARWASFGIRLAFVPARATEWDDEARLWSERQKTLQTT